ncbi:GNAT family N-acetyltransferase [Nocardia sp. NPDC052254]|uniref:GNAT family N-acetyltransferase n=1 Tax=Nocardia sp. NPDC052254 TaxID=3155681 RepID=UPI003428B1A8
MPDIANPLPALTASPPAGSAGDPWRQAWCRLYDTSTGVVPLGRIMHWRSVIAALGVGPVLGGDAAMVTRGYFYQPHTACPAPAEVRFDRSVAESVSASWLMYPVVRAGESAVLADAGYASLPWFLEAEFVRSDDVDHDLRDLLGGTRFRELRRLGRRADEHFAWEVRAGTEIDADALADFDRLHRLNLTKYGHGTNHFALPILRDLTESVVREHIRLFRYRRPGGESVQAVLAMHRPESATLDLLVQGIDHAVVSSSHNLYAAAIHRIYRWGAERGVRRFGLGRGAEQAKLGLGANRFHIVANHLMRVDGGSEAALPPLREAACAAIGQSLNIVKDAVMQSNRSASVQLPDGVR